MSPRGPWLTLHGRRVAREGPVVLFRADAAGHPEALRAVAGSAGAHQGRAVITILVHWLPGECQDGVKPQCFVGKTCGPYLIIAHASLNASPNCFHILI